MRATLRCYALLLSLLLATALSSVRSSAQWSADPAVNLAIADTAGAQELPKIGVTSDGGCYVAWFDTRAGAYRVYMQRLNPQGVKQWAPQGLLISSNPQSSSLVDWDLAVDDSNNALVVFTDTRNGGQIEPFAYKVSPNGDFRWGANGVALSTSSSTFQANPKVVATSDGNVVFAWIFSSTPRKIAMQKLNAAGVKQWGTDPILWAGTGTENMDYPNIVRSDSGCVLLTNSGYTGTFISPSNYRIYARKISPTGTSVWNANPDTVYGLGRVTGFFVPKMIPDGGNGAFCVWQDDRNSTNNSFTHVQRITSAGTKLFPINGTSASTLAGRLHNDAWVAHTPLTGETYVFWYETDAAFQSAYGVYGQKFSSTGARQWSDSGKAIRPFGGGQPSFIRAFGKDSSAVAFYLDGTTVTTSVVRGFRVDRNGNVLWGGSIKDVSSNTARKGRLVAALTTNGSSLVAWADQRVDANGVYGQRVNFDGTLGNPGPTSREDERQLPLNSSLSQNYPNPFNPTTQIEFQIASSGFVNVKVFDILGREVATLVNENMQAGNYSVAFDASALSSGVYFYRMQSGSFIQAKRMLVMK